MTRDRDDMESVLGGLDMFKPGSGRTLVSDEAIEAARDAAEIQERLDQADAQAESAAQQSAQASLPLAQTVEDLLRETPASEAGLRTCCEKLRAALRREMSKRSEMELENIGLSAEVRKLRQYAARQKLDIEALEAAMKSR